MQKKKKKEKNETQKDRKRKRASYNVPLHYFFKGFLCMQTFSNIIINEFTLAYHIVKFFGE